MAVGAVGAYGSTVINATETNISSCKVDNPNRPNIIMIMADDMGWGDVGFHENPIVKTPNLDRLASEGIEFQNFYASAPLSSPTRAAYLTGRNAYRTGVFSPNVGIIRREELTIPEILKKEGYKTGHFGKWHLGTLTYEEKDANRGCPENKHLYNPPAWHGYDEAFVTESKVPTYDPMDCPVKHNMRFWDYIKPYEERVDYGTYYWDINGKKVTEGLRGDDSKVIMNRVLPFIDGAIAEDNPFLSVVWFHAPHLPCVAGPEYAAMYEGLSLEEKNYYGCITALDDQVGRLVKYLKDKGVYDNTIIFFCSDNGPELRTPGSAGDYRGKKRSLHEGGLRVPAFVIGLNKLVNKNDDQNELSGKNDGQMNDLKVLQNCSTSDYLPTLVDLLNIDIELPYDLDGESFIPFVKGEKESRDKNLVFCSGNQGAVVSGKYKLYYSDGVKELYDIISDPYEKDDISKAYPKIVKSMFNALKQEMKKYSSTFNGEEYVYGVDGEILNDRKVNDKAQMQIRSVDLVPQKWQNIFKR